MSASTQLIRYEDSLNDAREQTRGDRARQKQDLAAFSKKHVYLIEKLSDILKAQLHRREWPALIAGAGLGIERAPLTYRIPDLMVFRNQALLEDSARTGAADPYIWAVPDLLVECLSPSNRKGTMRELLADYERAAVPEVWLLDQQPPQFTAYH